MIDHTEHPRIRAVYIAEADPKRWMGLRWENSPPPPQKKKRIRRSSKVFTGSLKALLAGPCGITRTSLQHTRRGKRFRYNVFSDIIMGAEPRIVQVDDEAAVIEKLCALVEAKAKVPGPTLNVGKLFSFFSWGRAWDSNLVSKIVCSS